MGIKIENAVKFITYEYSKRQSKVELGYFYDSTHLQFFQSPKPAFGGAFYIGKQN